MPTIDMLHISDTHGTFPKLLDGPKIIVHSGDLMPNDRCNREWDQHYQKNWIQHNAAALREWIGDRTFLLTTGNHDFYNPCPDMYALGIDARCLNNRFSVVDELVFYGFPYVPSCSVNKTWAGELEEDKMVMAVDEAFAGDYGAWGAQIFVPHCPLYGVLDVAHGQHLGSVPLRNRLIDERHKAVLHGHIHESFGVTEWNGMIVSNAATGQRIVSINL